MFAKKWKDSDIETIRQFLAEGKTVSYISKIYEVTEDNLRMIMSRNGLRVKENNSGAPSKLKREEKTDLATRIRMLRGEEILKTASHFSFSDEQLRKWIEPEGFVLFAKEVLDVDLQDYQIDAIRNILNYKRVVWVAGRATGKSFTIAIACLYIVITRSNQRILIISPAQRQSDLLYNQILEYIGKNNELFNSVQRSNAECCKFTNNSEIYPLPSTTFIRGFQKVNFIFLDESAFFESPEETLAAIAPMLGIRDENGEYGALAAVGSPAGKTGLLWDFFNDPFFIKMQTPSTINKYVSSEWIEKQKISMPPAIYDCEIMAQFSESIDNFFSYDLLRKISQEYDYLDFPEPDKDYYFGIDIGRVRDSSVITVLSIDADKMKKVENIIELNNVEFRSQIEHIKKLNAIYRPKKICIEKAGLSLQMVEELKKSFPILEFEPTMTNKEESYSYLLKQMQEGKVIISSLDRSLQYQLRTFKYEITETGKMKLHHESEMSRDDYVDSLMMAVWATKDNSFCFSFVSWK